MYTHQLNFSDWNATQYMPKSRVLLLLDYLPDLGSEQDNDWLGLPIQTVPMTQANCDSRKKRYKW